MTEQGEIEKAVYSYSSHLSGLEEENRYLRENVEGLRQELDRFKKKPLLVCKCKEILDDAAVIRLPNGNEFLVSISEECKDINAGDTVLAEQKNLVIVKKVVPTKRFDVEKFVIIEKPSVPWSQVGGLKNQEREIKEIIELPLLQPELFKKVGIDPPKGILLHGPPGTGKTLLAKAVAASTNSTFIEIVASELVQKYIGEGSKLVKEIFELAREKAPSIVFIDEIDALAATRLEIGTSGEREVQRTFMQLLSEIDGFKSLDNVKIIGCTNRKDILDPAVLRPGRLDRLIRVPNPDQEARKEIFLIHSKNMNFGKEVRVDELVEAMEGFSGADVKAACTEAGYFAIREAKTRVTHGFFRKGIEKVKQDRIRESTDFKTMFG